MKIRIRELREMIRTVLSEDGFSTTIADPTTEPRGLYGYDLDRGADIHSFWYRSPGRAMGKEGDPGRPDDSMSYIGMKPPAPIEDVAGEFEEAGEPTDLNDVGVEQDKEI